MIKNIFLILNNKSKKLIFILLLLYIPTLILETISLSAIPIFIMFLNDPSFLVEKIPFETLQTLLLEMKSSDRAIKGSIFLLILFTFKSLALTFITLIENYTQRTISVFTATKLYRYYLHKKYNFFIKNIPSTLIQNLGDAPRVTSVIMSCLNLLKESLLILTIFIIIIINSPDSFLQVFLGIISLIMIFLFLTNNYIKDKGNASRKGRRMVLKENLESFLGIKFTKIMQKEEFFIDKFSRYNNETKKADMMLSFFTRMPRYWFELMVIILFCFIINYYSTHSTGTSNSLPLLSFLGICAIRLLPGMGAVVNAISIIRFNYISAQTFKDIPKSYDQAIERQEKKIVLSDEKNFTLKINNLSFSHNDANIKKIIDNVSLEFKNNLIVGITGASGSGKTTFVDLILGLLKPSNGTINYNDNDISIFEDSWKNKVSFVPQNVYLFGSTLKENIVFDEIEKGTIDEKRLLEAIRIAELEEVVSGLENGMNTHLSYSGSKLSGGQVQRIGIARALYKESKILIFDEATSSIDCDNEKKILGNLTKIKKEILILHVTHRNEVMNYCDQIFKIQNGKINQEK